MGRAGWPQACTGPGPAATHSHWLGQVLAQVSRHWGVGLGTEAGVAAVLDAGPTGDRALLGEEGAAAGDGNMSPTGDKDQAQHRMASAPSRALGLAAPALSFWETPSPAPVEVREWGGHGTCLCPGADLPPEGTVGLEAGNPGLRPCQSNTGGFVHLSVLAVVKLHTGH